MADLKFSDIDTAKELDQNHFEMMQDRAKYFACGLVIKSIPDKRCLEQGVLRAGHTKWPASGPSPGEGGPRPRPAHYLGD